MALRRVVLIRINRLYKHGMVGQGDVLRLEVTIDHEEIDRRREDVRVRIERLERSSEDG